MAKNYFNRYVWLIDTINRHGHISRKELSDLWENSPLNETGEELYERTFHNHREAILDTFGIEIKCDRSLGYYIANSDELEGDGVRQWLLESLSLNNLMNESSDYTLFQYHLVPTFDFKQEILSRGSTFEVLSPEWFRDEVKEEIAAMYKNYGL